MHLLNLELRNICLEGNPFIIRFKTYEGYAYEKHPIEV